MIAVLEKRELHLPFFGFFAPAIDRRDAGTEETACLTDVHESLFLRLKSHTPSYHVTVSERTPAADQ